MKVNRRNNKYVVFRTTLYIILSLFLAHPTFAEDKLEQEEDSLKEILTNETDPNILIPALKRLAKLNELKPIRVYYLEQQYKLATEVQSNKDIYNALANLSNYYYNCLNQRDSLLFWSHKIDSIASLRKEYPNALFLAKSYLCRDRMWKKDYETALTEAEGLYNLAVEQQQAAGLIYSSECLGIIYKKVAQEKDAVAIFQTALDQMENPTPKQREALDMTQSEILDIQLRLSCLQLESAYRAGLYKVAEQVAEKYLTHIKEQELLNNTANDTYPIKREYWMYYSLCIDLYTREQKFDKAKEAIQEADKYDGNIFVKGDYVELVNWFSKASYYKATDNLPLAHYYIDEVLKTDRIPDELQLKADLLKLEGRTEEVLTLYDEIYRYNQEKNNETFLRQVNQLRTLHEINELGSQKRELEYTSKRVTHKKKQLLAVSSAIGFLLVLLYMLNRFVRRTQRLKNELQHEKESLIQSEERLIKERDKAEKASRMKSTFVANMSHEIRTPLNAIVGFSDILINGEAEPEEKEEFSRVIKNNTELLLTLINDVLDLSRMETGDMVFKMNDHPLLECCQKALDSVRYRIPDGVQLTFTPDPHPIIVHTDNLRIQQLLTNFLTNAAKFTTQGEISLAYTLEPDGKSVRITVTDTGCGIPLEKQADIFKRFEKLDDYKPGAGLGLSICGIIAERVGGSISIDPSYTDGARFVFVHPCSLEDRT